MAKGHNYDRICVSIPIELANELRTDYPYVEFSSLITQMLVYAHQAEFMKRLSSIDPELYAKLHRESLNQEGRKLKETRKPPSTTQIRKAVENMEEFGL